MAEQTAQGAAGDRQSPTPGTFSLEPSGEMNRCERCGLRYQTSKSTSSLRLTYCSFLCELGDLGFSIAGLESMERKEPPTEEEAPDVGELASVE